MIMTLVYFGASLDNARNPANFFQFEFGERLKEEKTQDAIKKGRELAKGVQSRAILS